MPCILNRRLPLATRQNHLLFIIFWWKVRENISKTLQFNQNCTHTRYFHGVFVNITNFSLFVKSDIIAISFKINQKLVVKWYKDKQLFVRLWTLFKTQLLDMCLQFIVIKLQSPMTITISWAIVLEITWIHLEIS
jgi:hypothetical protein